MRKKLILSAALGGIALLTSAFALPSTILAADDGVVLTRTVCDQDGNCWREKSPAEEIMGGVFGEGRSVHRDYEGDRMDRRRRMNEDRDRGYDDGRNHR
jgi:hypothetical protein